MYKVIHSNNNMKREKTPHSIGATEYTTVKRPQRKSEQQELEFFIGSPQQSCQ